MNKASATWVEPTGQMEYTVSWDGPSPDVWMSGVNLNDGTTWTSPRPVYRPERFGPPLGAKSTLVDFFTWVAKFQEGLE